MDNFSVFNKHEIKARLDGFAPGMAEHITPIKYEALTPDMFCFAFRTTGKDNQDYYFVLFSFDHVSSFQRAVELIESWHGSKAKNFLQPDGNSGKQTSFKDEDLSVFACDYDDVYYSVLAEVERPAGNGYWATNIVILPGDNIDEKLKHLSPEDLKNAKQTLGLILNDKRLAEGSNFTGKIVESVSHINPNEVTTNTSNYAISLYKLGGDGWELFYDTV